MNFKQHSHLQLLFLEYESKPSYAAITPFQAFIDVFDIELYLLPCALSSVGKALSRVPRQNTAKLTVLGKHRRSGAAPHTSPPHPRCSSAII